MKEVILYGISLLYLIIIQCIDGRSLDLMCGVLWIFWRFFHPSADHFSTGPLFHARSLIVRGNNILKLRRPIKLITSESSKLNIILFFQSSDKQTEVTSVHLLVIQLLHPSFIHFKVGTSSITNLLQL